MKATAAAEYLGLEQAPSREDIDRGTGLVLLEFGTDWCPICRALAPYVNALVEKHPQVRHVKVEDGPGRKLGRSFRVQALAQPRVPRDGKVVRQLVRPTARGAPGGLRGFVAATAYRSGQRGAIRGSDLHRRAPRQRGSFGGDVVLREHVRAAPTPAAWSGRGRSAGTCCVTCAKWSSWPMRSAAGMARRSSRAEVRHGGARDTRSCTARDLLLHGRQHGRPCPPRGSARRRPRAGTSRPRPAAPRSWRASRGNNAKWESPAPAGASQSQITFSDDMGAAQRVGDERVAEVLQAVGLHPRGQLGREVLAASPGWNSARGIIVGQR